MIIPSASKKNLEKKIRKAVRVVAVVVAVVVVGVVLVVVVVEEIKSIMLVPITRSISLSFNQKLL
jgi:hypothetical protein